MGGCLRVIPACAGNTRNAFASRSFSTGHPRVRGEHRCSSSALRWYSGSSPRARGTHLHAPALDVELRVIPACAGNTHVARHARRPFPGHPRVRGEHKMPFLTFDSRDGSSPRARGTPYAVLRFGLPLRVIPACAGNTPGPPIRTRPGGSSPRARGTPLRSPVMAAGRRVIPACAGNTPTRAATTLSGTGHPRVRGEHSYALGPSRAHYGSSPRARGTRDRAHPRVGESRVIPACAGNTFRRPSPSRMASGHPRVRGEHPARCARVWTVAGSSPRARGTQPRTHGEMLDARVIPACAGNTTRRARAP